MRLIINKKEELEHIKEKSSYNYNFYKPKDSRINFEILEICDDDRSCDYYIVSGKEKLCIGTNSSDIGDEIEIDFGVKYT